MKIVVEVTDKGVNVYCSENSTIEVFDIREINEEFPNPPFVEEHGQAKTTYELALIRHTLGLIQIY